MSTTNITIRVDKDVKQKADDIFSQLGINFSTAINMFLLKTIRSNAIPFEVSLRPQPNANTEALENALVNLFASEKAQAAIGSIHQGSPSNVASVLSNEDLERLL